VAVAELVAVAVDLLEQGQLRPALNLLPPHQDAHVGRPAVEPVAVGTLAQQPGQLGHLRVIAGLAGRIQRRLPPGGGHLPDRDPGPLVEAEPDRVGHRPARAGVQFPQVLDHGVAAARPIDGD